MSNDLLSQHPKNIKELKPHLKTVKKINELEPKFSAYSNEELQHKTSEFKERLLHGESIFDLAPEAFATVREAAKRVLGMRPYNVQLLGGLVLLNGEASEMKTGEGKTLVAALPSYLIALEEKGVHIITVNEYLANRDKEQMGKIHEFLGLSVGLNITDMSATEKQEAYQCDITYGIGTEFGFDYLRDNMVFDLSQKVQRAYHFAIIDEIDSVLIDEAKTPLIIAGKDQPTSRLYKVCAVAIKSMKQDDDYKVDHELKVVYFTDDGITKCEKVFAIDNLFDLKNTSLFHSLLQSLRAHVLFERDVDYIVEEEEVKLVDMNTGRIMEGRSLSDGLHQAIESKEGLVNTEENKTFASITIQDYYRMYAHLSGMTGTAKTEEEEFRSVYGMDVISVPPNEPNRRVDHPDKVFVTKAEKYDFLLKEVQERHKTGQPILIGTTSIIQSDEVAEILDKAQLSYMLLNAKSVEQEADLIAHAGERSRITVATNMAGRGTDIVLGEGVNQLGGLHVIGTERNENERIDNQLKGRSGRQGDQGSSMFIISLEDNLFTRYAADELERLEPKLKQDVTGLVTLSTIDKFVTTAQKIAEGVHAQFREYNLQLESVINRQREVIYKFRDNILKQEDTLDFLIEQIESIPDDIIDTFLNVDIAVENMDLSQLEHDLNGTLFNEVDFTHHTFEDTNDVKSYTTPIIKAHFELLKAYRDDEEIQANAKGLSLVIIDDLWKKQLDTMAQLKEGIGMRQYKQEDPIQLFEKEGFELFVDLFNTINFEVSKQLVSLINQLLKRREIRDAN